MTPSVKTLTMEREYFEQRGNRIEYSDLIKSLPAGQTPTCEQLFSTYEWHRLRKEILTMDDCTCSQCRVSKYIKLSEEEYQGNYDAARELLRDDPFTYLYAKSDEDEQLAREYQEHLTNKDVMDMFGILRLNNEPLVPHFKLTDPDPLIEVFHKEFVSGTLPWEYPHDWFESLCLACHRKKHFEDVSPPKVYKDFDKAELIVVDKCDKCKGFGYIYQYQENGGVCYQCMGYGGYLM